MTLKEQIERERIYCEAVKQMVIAQTPSEPKDLGLWKPGCEPDYSLVKAKLK